MKIDLGDFTGDNQGRFKINKPFSIGDRVFATDGNLIVRVGIDEYPFVAGVEATDPVLIRLALDMFKGGWRS